MQILARNIPPISRQFFDELDKAFKFDVHYIEANATLSEIQQKVGQRQVVEWCRKAIRAHESTSQVDPIVKP